MLCPSYGTFGIGADDQQKMFIMVRRVLSTKNVDNITPAQCRAGRALLEMTQGELADAANLGLSTIVDFEKERRQVSSSALNAIREALEKAGVEFINENGGGPGVRVRTRRTK